jgi:hypothetical protein
MERLDAKTDALDEFRKRLPCFNDEDGQVFQPSSASRPEKSSKSSPVMASCRSTRHC